MSQLKVSFEADGFFSPVSVVDRETVNSYRKILESVEQKIGLLNYHYKIHTALDIAYQLGKNEKLLDKVE